MKKVDLVVIGLDSLPTLKSIYEASYLQEINKAFNELIYVDSGSSDGSQAFMRAAGFRVIQNNSTCCTASMGRHIGAKVSDADYICFIDSDMRINNLHKLILVVNETLGDDDVGFVGDVVDIYKNGHKRLRARKKTKYATSFGGFVTLERNDLITVGNWKVNISANEELELYVRFRSNDKNVLYIPEVSVNHYTIVESALVEFASIYLPIRKGRYGSLGVVAKEINSLRKLLEFIKLQPELLLFFIFVVSLAFSFKFAILLGIIAFTFTTRRRSWKYNFIVPGLFISVIVGLFKKTKKASISYEQI